MSTSPSAAASESPQSDREETSSAAAKVPLDVRSVALTVVTVVVLLAALRAAQNFLVPVIVSLLSAAALTRPVRALQRLGLSRPLAAGAVVAMVVGLTLLAGYRLSDDTLAALQRVPDAAERARAELRAWKADNSSSIGALQKAAEEVESVATETAGPATLARGATRVQVVQPALRVKDSLWLGSMNLLGLSSTLLLLVFFVFFALASGDLFKRKLVKIAGPALSKRRITVKILEDISRTIERFVLVMVAADVFVAVLAWLSFRALHLNQAAIWGLLCGLLASIPYFGPAIATAVVFVVALLQFSTLQAAFLAAGAVVLIASIEGTLLKPWLMSRQGGLNNVAVFLSLLFWSWFWGTWGALLAYPITMVLKVVADHVEGWRPISELLGP